MNINLFKNISNMKTSLTIPAILLFAAAIGQGCVSNKKYAELQGNYDKLQEKDRGLNQSYLVTQSELNSATDHIKSVDDQIAAAKANSLSLQDALNKCIASNGQSNINVAKLADQITAS